MSILRMHLAAFALAGSLAAQTAAPDREFEVTSIKPAAALSMQQMRAGQYHYRNDNAAYEDSNIDLHSLIALAFEVHADRVIGPGWMAEDYFSISAKLPSGATKADTPAMLRKLLADRFQLQIHRDQKIEPVYLLTAGKPPIALKPPADIDEKRKGCSGRPGQFSCRSITMQTLADQFTGMAQIATRMQAPSADSDFAERKIDREVIDQTNLSGEFDIDLQWIPATPLAGRTGRGANFPDRDPSVKATSIFAAVEAAGLKLEPGKHAFDTVTVDHVERVPTGN